MTKEIPTDAVTASLFSVIPVFTALIPSYIYFGYSLPPWYEWVIWSAVTVIIGAGTSTYLREEVDYIWAAISGSLRWIFVLAAFSLKEVARASGIEPVSGIGRVLTHQFVSELPLMIIGYAVGVYIWKKLYR